MGSEGPWTLSVPGACSRGINTSDTDGAWYTLDCFVLQPSVKLWHTFFCLVGATGHVKCFTHEWWYHHLTEWLLLCMTPMLFVMCLKRHCVTFCGNGDNMNTVCSHHLIKTIHLTTAYAGNKTPQQQIVHVRMCLADHPCM